MSMDPDGNTGTVPSRRHIQAEKYIDGQRDKHTHVHTHTHTHKHCAFVVHIFCHFDFNFIHIVLCVFIISSFLKELFFPLGNP